MLSLRAETEAERSAWICALLAAGAQDHPFSSHLSAHVPSAGADVAQSPLSIAKAGSARTFVPVPAGLRAGQQFQVEVPTGERFNVTVPAGAAENIEVLVPARCMQSSAASSTASTAAGIAAAATAKKSAAGAAAGGEGGEGGDTAWTLCRRFDVTLARPAGLALGLALAPSRAGHLTVTDVTPGGIAASSGAFRLGDMLVSMNDHLLSADLDAFIREFSALENEELVLGVQRVEDEEALQLLLEQVRASKGSCSEARLLTLACSPSPAFLRPTNRSRRSSTVWRRSSARSPRASEPRRRSAAWSWRCSAP